MNLSIIIVNWNTRQLLDNCLCSIYKETSDLVFEIFVVDNASSDKSVEMVREKYPKVKLIQNHKNLGFSVANNQAIRQAQGKYILILNSDTVILENALEKAVQIMEFQPEVGILGPKTLNENLTAQKTIRSDPALITQLILPTKMKKLFPQWKALKNYYQDNFNYEQGSCVSQLQGSFLLIRREALNKTGFFDEKFFIWFEEVDLCLRMRKAGYKLLYSPDIKIIHYGGKSFSQINTLKKQVIFSRSLLYYFWKNKPKWQWSLLYLSKLPVIILNKIIKFD
ncbi:glycosyltransferase family 2 protein [Patescibacteria group bacterium]